jgi:hypothetical protein
MIRRIALAVILLSVGTWAFLDRGEIELRVQRVYWAHRCATHVTPPGTVLFEADPVKAAQLIATNPDYVAYDPYAWPPCGAAYCPVEYRKYFVVGTGGNPFRGIVAPAPIAFLGERTSTAGHRRLIAIALSPERISGIEEAAVVYSAIVSLPGTLGGVVPRRVGPSLPGLPLYSGPPPSRHLRILPGVADPSDASRISIDFTTVVVTDMKPMSLVTGPNGRTMMELPRRGTLDIYLHDNDTLEVKLRKPVKP